MKSAWKYALRRRRSNSVRRRRKQHAPARQNGSTGTSAAARCASVRWTTSRSTRRGSSAHSRNGNSTPGKSGTSGVSSSGLGAAAGRQRSSSAEELSGRSRAAWRSARLLDREIFKADRAVVGLLWKALRDFRHLRGGGGAAPWWAVSAHQHNVVACKVIRQVARLSAIACLHRLLSLQHLRRGLWLRSLRGRAGHSRSRNVS